MLHQETVDAARSAARILDFFPAGDLKKIGREVICLCPFHNDSKPSLRLNPQKGTYFCDVCVEGGDTIKLLQHRDGLSFSEAVISIAERYKVPVQYADDQSAEKAQAQLEERRALIAHGEAAAARWHDALMESAPMSFFSYLEERGVLEAMEDWQLGMGSSKVWMNRPRLTIPLRDVQGRVIGFVARDIDWKKGVSPGGKWINSRNSVLFDKSRHVFALDRVVRTARRHGEVLVVEGQLDAIACHVHGLDNTVAVGGLGLTAEHVREITRTTGISKLVLALDGDAAGQRAQDRMLQQLLPHLIKGTLELRILTIPEGQDPAEVGAGMKDLVAAAPLWFEWWWDREVGRVDRSDPAALQRAHNGVRKILKALPDGAPRDYIQQQSAQQLQYTPKVSAAPLVQFATPEDCYWYGRRALRCCLLDEECSAMVSQIELMDPRHQQIQQVQQVLQMMGVDWHRMQTLLPAMAARLDQDTREEYRALQFPMPEVMLHLRGRELSELTHCLDLLEKGCRPAAA